MKLLLYYQPPFCTKIVLFIMKKQKAKDHNHNGRMIRRVGNVDRCQVGFFSERTKGFFSGISFLEIGIL